MVFSVKYLVIVCLILIMPCSLFCTLWGRADGVPLNLDLKFDKSKYQEGDTVSIRLELFNNGKDVVGILPWNRPYKFSWIELSNGGISSILTARKLEYEIRFRANDDDIIFIKPGDSFKTSLSGVYHRSNVFDSDTHQMRDGLWLEFDDSAILVPQKGVYRVTGKFFVDPTWVELISKKPGIVIWAGEVKSKNIEVQFD